jgi:hypothetical protein
MACIQQTPGTVGFVLAGLAVGMSALFLGTLFGVFGGKI